MSMTRRDRWYENAIVYCLDVETFMDAEGDGVGDFVGLTERLDDLAGLGVTCLWLLPFYPSPNRDDGYVVTDYFTIDPRFGTFGDCVDFIGEASDRGIRVIADLVANHTSNEHPSFQAARRPVVITELDGSADSHADGDAGIRLGHIPGHRRRPSGRGHSALALRGQFGHRDPQPVA